MQVDVESNRRKKSSTLTPGMDASSIYGSFENIDLRSDTLKKSKRPKSAIYTHHLLNRQPSKTANSAHAATFVLYQYGITAPKHRTLPKLEPLNCAQSESETNEKP